MKPTALTILAVVLGGLVAFAPPTGAQLDSPCEACIMAGDIARCEPVENPAPGQLLVSDCVGGQMCWLWQGPDGRWYRTCVPDCDGYTCYRV